MQGRYPEVTARCRNAMKPRAGYAEDAVHNLRPDVQPTARVVVVVCAARPAGVVPPP